jgi:hypothetical protein
VDDDMAESQALTRFLASENQKAARHICAGRLFREIEKLKPTSKPK